MKECIFCGGRVNSKEHAWPNWLVKLLKQTADEQVATDAQFAGGEVKRWVGVDAAIKFKNVCQTTCNGGWMSELEDRARPILTDMLMGKPVTLSATQQLTVSAWLTKCAMLFDSIDRRGPSL